MTRLLAITLTLALASGHWLDAQIPVTSDSQPPANNSQAATTNDSQKPTSTGSETPTAKNPGSPTSNQQPASGYPPAPGSTNSPQPVSGGTPQTPGSSNPSTPGSGGSRPSSSSGTSPTGSSNGTLPTGSSSNPGKPVTDPSKPVGKNPPTLPNPQRNPNHGLDTRRGMPPCGYPGSNCSSPSTPSASHSNTARNIGIGVGAGVLAGAIIAGLAHRSSAGAKLSEHGPQLPDTLNQSAFQVTGFVRGGWPLVLDYEPSAGSYLVLTVVTPGVPPFTTVLPAPDGARRLLLFRIPASFGDVLRIANFSVESTISQTNQTLTYLRVYGIGCGPRAVGSVAIDQLRFGPQIVTRAQPETQLSFHSHSKFDRVRSEFIQVALVDHCVEGHKVDERKINRQIEAEENVRDSWNAKQARPGQIQYRVRGWYTRENGGDWVSAFSPELVRKQ